MTTPPPAARTSRAAAERSEPRASRTRERVLDAVIAALADGPVDALSVSDLCRRAGIHRVTFYGHWPDAHAAAVDAMTGIIDRLATIDEQAIAATSDPIALAHLYEDALTAQLARIAEDRAIYTQLATNALFERGLRETLERRARLAVTALAAAGVVIPAGSEATAAAYLAGGVTAATLAWVREDRDDVAAAAREMLAQLPGWWPQPAT